jgi:hypothetical protein
MKQVLLVALTVAALCTAASAAGISYTNSTGGTVYELDQPTGWAVTGASGETVLTLTGAGPNGTDAYYRSGATGPGQDDSTQAYWNFSFANLPNVGTALVPGEYVAQAYASNYGGLAHEDNGVYGSANGAWGYHALGNFSSWNGTAQSPAGWTGFQDWGTGTGGAVWLSNTGDAMDVTVSVKWNPWGGYGGLAVSGLRISTDGNFTPVPEPVSALLLVVGGAMMLRRGRKA